MFFFICSVECRVIEDKLLFLVISGNSSICLCIIRFQFEHLTWFKLSVPVIASSRRARNLVCTPYLDLEQKSFGQNRSINPRKPIRSHELEDGQRVGQCTRFCLIGVLTYIERLKMERNCFKEYPVLAMRSKEEQQAMKSCFDKLNLRFDANRQWNRRRPNYTHINSSSVMEMYSGKLFRRLENDFGERFAVALVHMDVSNVEMWKM